MEQETLRAQRRDESGSRPARRMRREGRVPAIVYGTSLEPVSISVDRRDLYSTLHTEAGLNALINLVLDDAEVLAVAREIQRDPVRGDITHLDLIQVSLDVAIEAEVHLEYVGVPVGVREEGAFVEAIETTVMLMALPGSIPSSIEVDISELGIGDALRVDDLPMVEGVTYVTDPDRPLVTVLLPSVEEEPEPELELVEGELPREGLEAAEAEAEAPETGEAPTADEPAEG
jgi:large subunit ribosomal protein L25